MALFFNFVFCPYLTQIYVNLRKFMGKWCSKWCSRLVYFQLDFLCFPCISVSLHAGFSCVVRHSSNTFASNVFSSLLAQINDSRHLLRSTVKAGMSVNIQCNAHIRMSHYILQVLDIHARICHVGTKCMAEHMGRNMGQWFIRVQLLVFLHCPTHFIFDMQRYFRLIIFIQQKETTISVRIILCVFLPRRDRLSILFSLSYGLFPTLESFILCD